MRNMMRVALLTLMAVIVFGVAPVSGAPASGDVSGIQVDGDRVTIRAGVLTRTLELGGGRIISSLSVDGESLLSRPSQEFSVTFYQAQPNARPVGLEAGAIEPLDVDEINRGWGRQLRESPLDEVEMSYPWSDPQEVEWIDLMTVDGQSMAEAFRVVHAEVTKAGPGVTRLNVRARVFDPGHPLRHVAIDLFYEVYDGYAVIRKWVEVSNNGPNWLKIDSLVIDAIDIEPALGTRVRLTPREYGVESCVIGFGDEAGSRGVIAGSEIPSGLRAIGAGGAMGYAQEFFEWVLGPSERFVSEPVFHMGYHGAVEQTVSGVSTALDRAVEGPFVRFIERHVGVMADAEDSPAPVWCSWANFKSRIDDASMREQADLAARAGFRTFLIDDGWSHPSLGSTEPVVERFPDFDATARYITSTGLRLGLWITCYRHGDSQDCVALPEAVTEPAVLRRGGLSMSFTSPWRDYFANDLVYMRDRFGATYVKEDFSNIIFGDIRRGHESRTRKESILRGLRGLLEINAEVVRRAPGMTTQITHEIYWATPGPACDIAAIKHVRSYHIPPNVYLGNPNANARVSQEWDLDPEKIRQGALTGCWLARQRYYAHRGLPLYPLEFYAAVTANFQGSLSPQVQDRQIASWLMGILSVFSGDLSSLTEENIEHYRRRFEMVERLQDTYNIYRYFQFSGVPAPTDTDWHWWGKLNEDGYGAVVVLRGSEGAGSRAINIPWVLPERTYRVTALLGERELGEFTGVQLQGGEVNLALGIYGQEILELAAVE